MFQITGEKFGLTITMRWDAGAVTSSHPIALDDFNDFLRECPDMGPPTGPTTHGKSAHLLSSLSSQCAMRLWFDRAIQESGELQPPLPVPRGCVA